MIAATSATKPPDREVRTYIIRLPPVLIKPRDNLRDIGYAISAALDSVDPATYSKTELMLLKNTVGELLRHDSEPLSIEIAKLQSLEYYDYGFWRNHGIDLQPYVYRVGLDYRK
jgi:hypothetical protein